MNTKQIQEFMWDYFRFSATPFQLSILNMLNESTSLSAPRQTGMTTISIFAALFQIAMGYKRDVHFITHNHCMADHAFRILKELIQNSPKKLK